MLTTITILQLLESSTSYGYTSSGSGYPKSRPQMIPSCSERLEPPARRSSRPRRERRYEVRLPRFLPHEVTDALDPIGSVGRQPGEILLVSLFSLLLVSAQSRRPSNQCCAPGSPLTNRLIW